MLSRFTFAFGRIAKALTLLTLSCAVLLPAAYAQPKASASQASTAAVTKNKKAAKASVPRKASAQKKTVKARVKKVASTRTAKKKQTPSSARKANVARAAAAATVVTFASPSFGQLAGLHKVPDPLDLKSSVALILDQETNEILFRKNDHAVLPIASITKLMTGLLVVEADLPMDEMITITQDDVDTEKHSPSRLRVGSTLPRSEMLHLALMASENRAAHALGRTFPGGMPRFVSLMNDKAKALGMADTQYVEPTGLSSRNQSSAHDLATLVNAVYKNPVIRAYSTSHSYTVAIGKRALKFNNTNSLVKSDRWDIGLQKTGFIDEAGRCLVMQAEVAGRKLIMVFLDSVGKYGRQADAERVRRWIESGHQTLAAKR